MKRKRRAALWLTRTLEAEAPDAQRLEVDRDQAPERDLGCHLTATAPG
mgnify:CR=1 FL=1